MANEVERKFLIARMPAPDVLGVGSHLRQGYLAEEGDVEVRIRIREQGSVITVKAGSGLSRTEVERAVDADEATALWTHTVGRRIEKVRYRVGVEGGVAEVDVYDAPLSGLQVVEVEFDSAEAAAAFHPPAWFGRELTGAPGWSNASLARNGVPEGGPLAER
ncbi:MAG: hypothetical protein JWM34_4196 [Ilumatobacteraceae bacterium]|nr:hypothetical protein [Ilumatobacteraceae bacterium]